MPLKKGYLRQKNTFSISAIRLIAVLLIALTISLTIYALLCFIRAFIIFQEGYFLSNFFVSNGSIIISAKDLYWQNFSFALLALVIGHSFFLTSVFTRPLNFSFSNSRRGRIINDQTFLSFNFYFFFFKTLFLTGLLIGFEFIHLFKQLYLLFYLMALVLFLESYKSILLVFKRKAYKYMVLSGLMIVVVSLLFAFYDVFSTKKWEVALLEKNPIIELPISNYNTEVFGKNDSYFNNQYFVKIIKKENTYQYQLDGINFSNLNELHKKFQEIKLMQYHYVPTTVYIYAPSDMDMSEINKLRLALFDVYHRGFVFVTTQEGLLRNNLRGILKRDGYSEEKIQQFLLENNITSDTLSYPTFFEIKPEKSQFVTIQIIDGVYFINDIKTDENKLTDTFVNYINDKNVFHCVYSEEETTYQDFITVYSAYRQAVDSLRRKEQKVISEYTNQKEYEEDQNRVMAIYPIRFYENDVIIKP